MSLQQQNKNWTNNQRKEIICELLEEHEELSVADLAKQLQVTMQTIRRDLKELDRQNKLVKRHGKVLKNSLLYEPSFQERLNINLQEKAHIGHYAAGLISDNNTIFCDPTTTVYCFLQKLTGIKNLFISINSFVSMQTVQQKIRRGDISAKVQFLGGELDLFDNITHGDILDQQIERYFFDKAFIGAGGISLEYGLTAFSDKVGHIAGKMMQQARKTILLIDHTKVEKRTFYSFGKPEQIHTIVTTIPPPSTDWEQFLREHEIRWVNVSRETPHSKP